MKMKDMLISKGEKIFSSYFKVPHQFTSLAPGRINIIGEHTDYTGGLSIPKAIDCHTATFCSHRNDRKVVFYVYDQDEVITIDLDQKEFDLTKSFRKYILGAYSIIREQWEHGSYVIGKGLNLLILGNVPIGKGLSSSASLEISLLNALNFANDQKLDDQQIVLLAQQIEHRYLNIPSGLLDQYACQFSKDDHFMIIDFQKDTIAHFPCFNNIEQWCFIGIDTQEKRELSLSNYAQRVSECQTALKLLNIPDLHYRDLKLEEINKTQLLDKRLKNRLRYIIEENIRTQAALNCLIEGDFVKLGELLNETHQGLKSLYEVSSSSLDSLQIKASSHPACSGARMMGGGFGGYTLNLVQRDGLIDFIEFMGEEIFSFKFTTGAYIEKNELIP